MHVRFCKFKTKLQYAAYVLKPIPSLSNPTYATPLCELDNNIVTTSSVEKLVKLYLKDCVYIPNSERVFFNFETFHPINYTSGSNGFCEAVVRIRLIVSQLTLLYLSNFIKSIKLL